MKIEFLDNFRKMDNKAYELLANADFLNSLNRAISKGYECYISVDELQALINLIANWYEIKYPERDFETAEKKNNFQSTKRLSSRMGINELLYRMNDHQIDLLKASYRTVDWGIRVVSSECKEVKYSEYLLFKIKCLPNHPYYEKYSYFKIVADPLTGLVDDTYELRDYKDKSEEITLEELLKRFKKSNRDDMDFSSLENCILNHSYDIELRAKIIELVALKLFYSPTTTPERGYIRAKKLFEDFNRNFGLNLRVNFINELLKQYQRDFKQYQKSLDKWHGIRYEDA